MNENDKIIEELNHNLVLNEEDFEKLGKTSYLF